MTTRLDQRGWTAALDLAPCVPCQRPAIMRSPPGTPYHWACPTARTDDHQDYDQEHGKAPRTASARRARAAAWRLLGDTPARGPHPPADSLHRVPWHRLQHPVTRHHDDKTVIPDTDQWVFFGGRS